MLHKQVVVFEKLLMQNSAKYLILLDLVLSGVHLLYFVGPLLHFGPDFCAAQDQR